MCLKSCSMTDAINFVTCKYLHIFFMLMCTAYKAQVSPSLLLQLKNCSLKGVCF